MGCGLQVEELERLIEKYLASIPDPEDGQPEPISLMDITALPGSFPQRVVTENIRCVPSRPLILTPDVSAIPHWQTFWV